MEKKNKTKKKENWVGKCCIFFFFYIKTLYALMFSDKLFYGILVPHRKEKKKAEKSRESYTYV